MDKNIFDSDVRTSHPQCGVALCAGSGGICKDPDCRKRASVLVNGYCAGCVSKHGLNPLTLNPSAPACDGDCSGNCGGECGGNCGSCGK